MTGARVKGKGWIQWIQLIFGVLRNYSIRRHQESWTNEKTDFFLERFNAINRARIAAWLSNFLQKLLSYSSGSPLSLLLTPKGLKSLRWHTSLQHPLYLNSKHFLLWFWIIQIFSIIPVPILSLYFCMSSGILCEAEQKFLLVLILGRALHTHTHTTPEKPMNPWIISSIHLHQVNTAAKTVTGAKWRCFSWQWWAWSRQRCFHWPTINVAFINMCERTCCWRQFSLKSA